ncbi:MAG: hypothetical protein ABIR79_17565, partial [Candidatus Binatia bacterium]
QLVDVAWAIFILLGVEHFHLDPALPSNPLVLDHMPYTHSLLGTLAWAALGGAIVVLAGFGKTRAAVVTGLVVCSHWVLDVLVHRPDMTLVGSDAPFGLALWNRPVLAFVVEIAVLVGAAAFAVTQSRVGEAERRAVVRGVGVLVLLQIFTTLGPVPPSPTAMVLSVLATFLLVAWGAARMERRLAR